MRERQRWLKPGAARAFRTAEKNHTAQRPNEGIGESTVTLATDPLNYPNSGIDPFAAAMYWSDSMILLIEDEAVTRDMLAGALRTYGEKILEAANGEKALRLLAAHPGIKLVVMEFVLPGVDGVKLMNLIHQRRPGLPIVLVSGYLSQWAGNAIIASSMKGTKFFAKPFRPSALVKTVRELLTR